MARVAVTVAQGGPAAEIGGMSSLTGSRAHQAGRGCSSRVVNRYRNSRIRT